MKIRNADISMGNDVVIDHDITNKQPIRLGNHCAIDKGFYCTVNTSIGDYVHISPYVTVIGGHGGKFIAEGFNNIMTGARIICVSDRFDDSGLFGAMIPDKYLGTQIVKPVIMEKFSNVGTNAIVLPGSILRQGVLLTAGSLLKGDTEPWGIYQGNPAKLKRKIDGTKIKKMAKELEYT